MTHAMQATALDRITELLAEHGFDGLASAVTVLLNEVMKIERAQALGAGPYERSEGRTGYANGFKPRTIHTRLGALTVEVPQARGVEFYPSNVEKGIRSERALKLAVGDAHAGLRPALDARLTGVPWQRCQFHLVENAMAFVPRPAMRKGVVASIRAVLDAPARGRAAVGHRREEVPHQRPEAGRVAGGQHPRRAGSLHPAGVAPPPAAGDQQSG